MSSGQYPFVPKSTTLLLRGQFWSIPLPSGFFGAGCVVGRHLAKGKVSSRVFIAAVLNWRGRRPPTADDLVQRTVADFGFAHVKTITSAGGAVLGKCEAELGGLPEEAEALSLPAWGLRVAEIIASRKVVANAD